MIARGHTIALVNWEQLYSASQFESDLGGLGRLNDAGKAAQNFKAGLFHYLVSCNRLIDDRPICCTVVEARCLYEDKRRREGAVNRSHDADHPVIWIYEENKQVIY